MIPFINPDGFYVVEDIWSSCRDWAANMGTHLAKTKEQRTGGAQGCMKSADGKETMFAHVVEIQRLMVDLKPRFPDVTYIDFHRQAVVMEKKSDT